MCAWHRHADVATTQDNMHCNCSLAISIVCADSSHSFCSFQAAFLLTTIQPLYLYTKRVAMLRMCSTEVSSRSRITDTILMHNSTLFLPTWTCTCWSILLKPVSQEFLEIVLLIALTIQQGILVGRMCCAYNTASTLSI